MRVALDLSREQMLRGHDVVLFAGAQGFDTVPTEISGVPVRLFPVRSLMKRFGYASLYASGLSRALVAEGASSDIIHIHLARDLITASAATSVRRHRLPYVVQSHGMIDASDRFLAAIIDKVSIAKALKGALSAMALTEQEEVELQRLSHGKTSIVLMPNGIASSSPSLIRGPKKSSVLFLARLHPRKGAVLFIKAAVLLCTKYSDVNFIVAGPDEGDLARVEDVLRESPWAENRVHVVGPVAPEEVRSAMSSALIYVLPAANEPFGLTILEALSQGSPVIVHATANLAGIITEASAGLTFVGEEEELASAISKLLDERENALQMGQNGRALVEERFSLSAVAERVMHEYRR